MDLEARKQRAEQANEFISVIANCGRRFFKYGTVSKFTVDDSGRIWFWDAGSGTKLYTHYKYRWKGFSEGGTLLILVKKLKEFIQHGLLKNLNLGPWPQWICDGDPWGYGDDMEQIREAAKGMLKEKPK